MAGDMFILFSFLFSLPDFYIFTHFTGALVFKFSDSSTQVQFQFQFQLNSNNHVPIVESVLVTPKKQEIPDHPQTTPVLEPCPFAGRESRENGGT